MSIWYATTFTIGTGVRVTPITVTTTASALDTLLDVAVTDRASMPGRRNLIIRNNSAVTVYLLESSSQTTTDGWEILAGEDFAVQASETGTANEVSIANGGGGFYLKVASGTAAVKILESK